MKLLISTVALALCLPSYSATLITINSVTASEWGDNYGTGAGAVINGSGIDTSANPSDPSQWVFSGTNYKDEWMATPFTAGTTGTALNNKLAWISFDFGSVQSLDKMYLFNTNYQSGASGTDTFNLYYTNTPATALPAAPTKNNFSSTGLTPQGDYDFSTWTKFNTGALSATKSAMTDYDLSGVSAQYVAIEILSNHGDTYDNGRVGMDEVAFTAVPEPSALGLLALGGMGFLLRRRR